MAGGNEPDADGGLEGWANAPVAQALLLLLKKGAAWNELSATEQYRVTLLEAAMGYAGNYTYNDTNNFSSGICGYGDFTKTSNPNYEDGYVDVELAAIEFFGPATWDTMLTDFNDATVTAELDAAGLTNAGGCFATVGSAANAAIDIPFVWKGIPATDPKGMELIGRIPPQLQPTALFDLQMAHVSGSLNVPPPPWRPSRPPRRPASLSQNRSWSSRSSTAPLHPCGCPATDNSRSAAEARRQPGRRMHGAQNTNSPGQAA